MNVTKLRCKQRYIIWDINDDENGKIVINPPPEIEIPDGMDEEKISDYLSDVTGFCHKGYILSD